ncbi:MAG: HD domain-containing protein [Termitinemataceae bacterium]|nr:MAG: HD domain-containing protein [Termitinemataceae bacterium]
MKEIKDRILFDEYAKEILENPIFSETKKIFSHGAISIYEHSIAVAELSFSIAENIKSIDKKCIVRAALLHDFFLYEWHIPGIRYIKHGWFHPAIAAKKARKVFGISDKEYSCIRTHMWPWTLFHPPLYREGWVISISDKIVAIRETVLCRGKRKKLQDPLDPAQINLET